MWYPLQESRQGVHLSSFGHEPVGGYTTKSVTHDQCNARPSHLQKTTAAWAVPNYTSWWQRHTGVSSLPKASTWPGLESMTGKLQVQCPANSATTPSDWRGEGILLINLYTLAPISKRCYSSGITTCQLGTFEPYIRDDNIKLHHIYPLKGRGVNWLHFAIQVYPTFLISDIRSLWGVSARVPECQKLKT